MGVKIVIKIIFFAALFLSKIDNIYMIYGSKQTTELCLTDIVYIKNKIDINKNIFFLFNSNLKSKAKDMESEINTNTSFQITPVIKKIGGKKQIKQIKIIL
ncbi:hypothetical protein VU05_00885 [Desulfobulbus sp. F1]|nr:hypothetical protein [Desulfobulbus sp. F1]